MNIFKMSRLVVSIVIVVFVSSASGLYIRNPMQEEKPFKSVLDSWNGYKQKIISEISASKEHNFNEMEVLEMIPLIIGQYRLNQIKAEDEKILSQVYGSLWPIIVQEANRNTVDDLDPMLMSIWQAYRSGSQALNDITTNFDISTDDHPSQRVLKTVAKLMRNNKEVSRPPVRRVAATKRPASREDTFDLKLTNIPINLIARSRRNIHIDVNDVDAMIKMYLQRQGLDNQDADDDYDEDEDIEDDVPESSKNKPTERPFGILYEDAGPPERTPTFGSIQDLILLATNNRLRESDN